MRPSWSIRDSLHVTSAVVLVIITLIFVPLPLLFFAASLLLRTLEGSTFLTPVLALFLFRPLLVDDVDDAANELDDTEDKCNFADRLVLRTA